MPSLLVVEDETKLLRSLTRGLEEEGYRVFAAGNGARGFELARAERPDAVVLDLMLPERNGLSVLRDLRRQGFPSPILIITARDAVEDRVLGLDSGADDYLVKPFAFSELLARLRALLRRKSPEEGTRLQVADLTIDLVHRQATRGNTAVELTNRQFDLLVYLARHANEAVTREMIVRDVWRETTEFMTNIVDVYVNQLRRKIEFPDRPALLCTVRGVGYMLRADSCAG